MRTQLILQEPRTVLDEPGSGHFLDFQPSSSKSIGKLIKQGTLRISGAHYCGVAGHFMGLPSYDLTSMVSAEWTQTGTWVETQPGFQADGSLVTFLAQKADADWELVETTAATAGKGRFVTIITYDTEATEGGVGTDSPITLTFGGVWKAELHDDGNAILFNVATDPATGLTTDTAVGQWEWMTADVFRGTIHQLWIYQVQEKLIIANVNQSLEGRRAGFVYHDASAVLGADDELDGEGERVKHALRSAPWRIAGGGFATVNISDQAWVAGAATVTQNPSAIDQGGSTMEVESATVHGASNGPIAATITVVDEDGSAWAVGTSTTSRRYGIGWTVSFTTTADHTFFLNAVDIKVPRLLRTEGGSGTDVLAITNVADQDIRLVREGDLTRERLTAAIMCYKNDLAEYVQPNMAIRCVVDTVTRFRGLTTEAAWEVLADTNPTTGLLTLQAEGLSKRFRKALWPGGKPFDGRLLTECLAEVLEAGGLATAGYSLTSWPIRFADTPRGEAPTFVYRPGTNIDRILEDFQRKFYGTSLFHYFRLSDGKFILAAVPTSGSVAANFYQRSDAALAAGVEFQTIRDGSFQATFDESELYNVIIVLGQQADGRPLMARCVDWPSINDNSVSNYTGEPWPLVVADPAFQTQGMVNYVCRQLYARHRRPKTYASWVSHRVDLFAGDLVGLVGSNYGYTYRLTGIQMSGGGGMDPAGLATYQGERVA